MITVLTIVVKLFLGVGALGFVTAAAADCALRPQWQFAACARMRARWIVLIVVLPVLGGAAYLLMARPGLQEAEKQAADDHSSEERTGWWTARVGTLPRWLPWTVFVVTLAGLADSAYLTYDHFTATLPICKASGVVNCALVTTSRFSHVFGIPVALLGLLFYVALTVVNSPPGWSAPWRWVIWLRAAMMLSGIGFVFYLINSELTLKALCEWCTGVHVVTFTLFVATALATPVLLAPRDTDWDWDWDWDGALDGHDDEMAADPEN